MSIGILGVVLAQHISLVGENASNRQVLPSPAQEVRELGPDGRPIDPQQEVPDGTIAKIYYVGDLVLSSQAPVGGGFAGSVDSTETHGSVASTPQVITAVDLKPLITLIASTVAPGTWNVVDEKGNVLAPALDLAASSARQGGQPQPVGSITPFFVSISLIIRCLPETHLQVAGLLKGLRDVVCARDANRQQSLDQLPQFATLPLRPPLASATATVPPAAPVSKQIAGSAPTRPQRSNACSTSCAPRSRSYRAGLSSGPVGLASACRPRVAFRSAKDDYQRRSGFSPPYPVSGTQTSG